MVKLEEVGPRNACFLLFYPPLPSCLVLLVTGPCRHGHLNEPILNVFLIPILPTRTYIEFYYNAADGASHLSL